MCELPTYGRQSPEAEHLAKELGLLNEALNLPTLAKPLKPEPQPSPVPFPPQSASNPSRGGVEVARRGRQLQLGEFISGSAGVRAHEGLRFFRACRV